MKFKKSLKSLKFIPFMFVATITLGATNVNAATLLPKAVDGVITLTENVTLSEKYLVNKDDTLVIDLAGYTLTGPSDNYAIDNQGKLSIIDKGKTKGKIECPSSTASCLRNFGGELKVEGVSVNTAFVAIKNEEKSTLTVKDSTLKSTFVLPSGQVTGTINNTGTATVDNSEIIADATGYAVYATSGATDEQLNSTININNSILQGKNAIYARYDNNSNGSTTQKVAITGGEIKGNLTGMASKGSDVSIVGDVKVSTDYLVSLLSFSKEGANVSLTTDVSGKNVKVPAGVKLIIPEDVTYTVSPDKTLLVNGELEVKGTLDAATSVPENKTYYGSLSQTVKYIGEGKNIIVLKDLTETTTSQPYANKDITIDLNGHTVKANITNVAETKMTIKDGSAKKEGTLDGTITNNGTLTIMSGNYSSIPTTSESATTSLVGGIYPSSSIENATVPTDKEFIETEDGKFTIEYKDADYSEVLKALEKVATLEEKEYTEESLKALETAINNVVEGKKANEQAEVDAMATSIYKAIDGLTLIQVEDVVIQNPETSDNVGFYIIMAVFSAFGLLTTGTYLKKEIKG